MDYQDRFMQGGLDPETEEQSLAPVFTPVTPPPGLGVVRSILLMLLVFVGTVDLLIIVFILRSLGLI